MAAWGRRAARGGGGAFVGRGGRPEGWNPPPSLAPLLRGPPPPTYPQQQREGRSPKESNGKNPKIAHLESVYRDKVGEQGQDVLNAQQAA